MVTIRLPWPVELLNLLVMGIGFYMVHGSIQVYVTELWPPARGSAVSLHSGSYFLGQAAGPVLYGYGFYVVGTTMTLVFAAVGVVLVGAVCVLKLAAPRRRLPER
jgi:predicted MFS family arabinose efflux permease